MRARMQPPAEQGRRRWSGLTQAGGSQPQQRPQGGIGQDAQEIGQRLAHRMVRAQRSWCCHTSRQVMGLSQHSTTTEPRAMRWPFVRQPPARVDNHPPGSPPGRRTRRFPASAGRRMSMTAPRAKSGAFRVVGLQHLAPEIGVDRDGLPIHGRGTGIGQAVKTIHQPTPGSSK